MPARLVSQWRPDRRLARLSEQLCALVRNQCAAPVADMARHLRMETATGTWLDWLGERLGRARPAQEDVGPTFGFSADDVGWDQARFATTTPFLAPRFPVGDEDYRRALMARRVSLTSHHIREDVEAETDQLFAGHTTWDWVPGSMTAIVAPPDVTDPALFRSLFSQGLLPVPSGVRVLEEGVVDLSGAFVGGLASGGATLGVVDPTVEIAGAFAGGTGSLGALMDLVFGFRPEDGAFGLPFAMTRQHVRLEAPLEGGTASTGATLSATNLAQVALAGAFGGGSGDLNATLNADVQQVALAGAFAGGTGSLGALMDLVFGFRPEDGAFGLPFAMTRQHVRLEAPLEGGTASTGATLSATNLAQVALAGAFGGGSGDLNATLNADVQQVALAGAFAGGTGSLGALMDLVFGFRPEDGAFGLPFATTRQHVRLSAALAGGVASGEAMLAVTNLAQVALAGAFTGGEGDLSAQLGAMVPQVALGGVFSGGAASTGATLTTTNLQQVALSGALGGGEGSLWAETDAVFGFSPEDGSFRNRWPMTVQEPRLRGALEGGPGSASATLSLTNLQQVALAGVFSGGTGSMRATLTAGPELAAALTGGAATARATLRVFNGQVPLTAALTGGSGSMGARLHVEVQQVRLSANFSGGHGDQVAEIDVVFGFAQEDGSFRNRWANTDQG